VFRIRTDPHNRGSPGSGSAWTDTDPDPGGESSEIKLKIVATYKSEKKIQFKNRENFFCFYILLAFIK